MIRARFRSTSDWLRRHPMLTGSLALLLVAGLFGVAGLALGTWRHVCRDCPSVAQIFVWEPRQSTKLLTHDGVVFAELAVERRTPVELGSLPEYVPLAFVAVEDKRFFGHSGFDLQGMTRGVINLLLRRPGGGSTITQQLARNMFEEEIGFERRVERKLKELKVAIEIERVYSKEQILEAYINQINYERGWWGIETAAQRYFGKPATELGVEEAALLAAVIKLPGHYSPFRNPTAARHRRNLVMGLMAQQGYIPESALDSLREIPVPENPHGPRDGDPAPYFVEWVRSELDRRYGSDLYERGYRVYTTLDLEMQRMAEQAMRTGWERIEGQPGFRHPAYERVLAEGGTSGSETRYLQGMFVALDPVSGEVRALIGGRDFGDSKFNRAVQARRQPGSAFKPFVYTAAIASGLAASHIVFDAPILVEQEGAPEPWSPKNYDGQFHGPVTMREAARQSLNLATAKIGLEVGLETVVQTAQRMGISTEIPRYPAITIGAAEVIPLDIVAAYSPLATEGIRTRPRGILRVEDSRGRVLWETRAERTQALDTLVAAVSRSLLSTVIDRGTGAPARRHLPYEIPAGGKTGTTNDETNIWFIGFTPDLLAGVWFGLDRPQRIAARATGGTFAAVVWGDFMASVYSGEGGILPPPGRWERPEALTTREVDEQSGLLATEWCPTSLVYTEIYLPGTEPTEPCDVHGPGGLLGRPLRARGDSVPDSLRVNRRFRF